MTPEQVAAFNEKMGKAPWTEDQVKRLNDYQRDGLFHPFTCPTNHPEGRDLVATTDGWACKHCGYTQNWAHEFMLTWDSERQLAQHPFAVRLKLGKVGQDEAG